MMKILVAEDDLTSRTILSAILRKWGYDPVVVSDGGRAWEIMQESDAPNLAILDWDMPHLDGLEVCRRIRENHISNPPYLILLTGKGEKTDIVRGLDSGANDYVSKPYDSHELHARIRVGQRMVQLQEELIGARNALAHEAMHDPLTGALNRRAILEGLHKELIRAERRRSNLSIGLCDIDHFKKVNDTYGHQVGDEVLCSFVRAIRGKVRAYDLVGRYGGEEFLVVAPDSAGLPDEGLYDRLRAETAGLRIISKSNEVRITVSIGVAHAEAGATVESLIAAADVALYRAKDEGRNRVVYAWSPTKE